METGYLCVCSVVSPDRDGLVAMVMVSNVATFKEHKKGGGLTSSAGPSWQLADSLSVLKSGLVRFLDLIWG